MVALLLSAVFAGAEAAATTPAATGSVVVTRDTDGNKDLYLRELGTGDERLLVPDLGQEHSGVYSPDGTKIAFVRETAGNAEIYVVDADGSDLLQITNNDDADLNPAWGPDSAALYFDSDRTGGLRQIIKVNINDLRSVTYVTDSSQWENYEPSVSPDGTWVAHATSEYGVPEEFLLVQIYKTHISTGSIAPLTQTTGKNRNPEFSPDGTQIAFSSNRVSGTAEFDIWVMDAAGDNETAVTTSTYGEGSPRWVTHDGRGAPRLMYVTDTATSDWDLKTIDVAGTNDGVTLGGTTHDVFGDMQPLPGCTIVWDGSEAANDWHEAGNWDLGRVPGAGDKVCIPDMQTDITVVHSTGTPTVDSITTSEDLTISGGAVTAPAVAANEGADVRVTGGTLTAATGVTATDGTFTVAGGTANIGALSSTGTGALTLTSGTLNATSIAPASGSAMALNGGTLGGPVTLASGSFTWPNSGSASDGDAWTIGSGATLDLITASSYWAYGPIVNSGTINLGSTTSVANASLGSITNTASGTIVKDQPDSNTSLNLPFDNDGLLDVVNGTVTLANNDGTDYAANNDAGTFNTSDTGTVSFAGRTNLGTATGLTGTGRFELIGNGVLDVDTHGLTMPAGQTMHLTYGTLEGSGTLAGPTYELTNSVNLMNPGDFTIHPDTTVNLVTASSYGMYGALVNNGTLNLGPATSLANYGNGSLTNSPDATITKDQPDSNTSLNLPFDNQGTVRAAAGTLTLAASLKSNDVTAWDATTGTFTSDGTYEVADAATLIFGTTVEILTNAGQFDIAGTGLVRDTTGQSVFRNLATNTGMLALRDGANLVAAGPLTNESQVIVGSDSTLTVAGGYTQSGLGAPLTRLHDDTDNATTARLVTPTATFDSGSLDGNGTIEGNVVNNGAVIAPGNSPGTMTVDGNFTQAGGKLQMEVFGSSAGDFDQVDVSGSATLGGGLEIVTHLYTPAWDDDFTLVTAPTQPTVSFDTVEGKNLASGMTYQAKVVDGVLKLLVADTVAPTNVTPTASHKPSVWSKDNTIKVNLLGAGDEHSGVDGYGVVWPLQLPSLSLVLMWT